MSNTYIQKELGKFRRRILSKIPKKFKNGVNRENPEEIRDREIEQHIKDRLRSKITRKNIELEKEEYESKKVDSHRRHSRKRHVEKNSRQRTSR